MGAVASRHVGRLAGLLGTIGKFQAREYATGRLLEAQQLRPALDLYAGQGQTIDQQPLVLVLRKDQRVRERAEVAAHITKGRMSHPFARYPQIHGAGLASTVHGLVSQTNLTVELQRACLDGQRARGRSAPVPPFCRRFLRARSYA